MLNNPPQKHKTTKKWIGFHFLYVSTVKDIKIVCVFVLFVAICKNSKFFNQYFSITPG